MSFKPRDVAFKFRLEEAIADFNYSLKDFEVDLWANRLRISENIRMAGADRELFPTVAAARQDALQWIFEGLAAGYTAIFNKLNLCNPEVAALSAAISRNYPVGAKTFVTAFLSPSSQHCFGYHFDEVDVFLVHIYGVKSWSVARPTVAWPVEGMNKPAVDQEQQDREYLSVDLAPGDVLYIPRGHIHKGHPGSTGSLHLSAGVHSPTVVDGLISALQHASHFDENLRLPASDSNWPSALDVLSSADLYRQRAQVPSARGSIYLPRDSLKDALRIADLRVSDMLVRRDALPLTYNLSPSLDSIEIWGLLFDYGVRFEQRAKAVVPAGYFRALEFIDGALAVTPIGISESAGVAVSDVLELCRRLISIGALEFQTC